jgi:thiamine-monophosphate kinase
MMSEGVHFDLAYTAPVHLGFKLVSVNVSDIMAMGGRPRFIVLSLSMRGDLDELFFRGFFDGVAAALDHYGMALVGGDLSGTAHDVVVSATVIGTAGKVLPRSGASPGDRIYVTGTLGDAACGLEMLKHCTGPSRSAVRQWTPLPGKSGAGHLGPLEIIMEASDIVIEGEIAERLIMRHLMPTAREVKPLVPYASSMIDVSDGLFVDLSRICDESGVGAGINLDALPLSREMKDASGLMGMDGMAFATSGGEDYELLFTVRSGVAVPEEELGITCIGEITEQTRTFRDGQGREFPLAPKGYEHFGHP